MTLSLASLPAAADPAPVAAGPRFATIWQLAPDERTYGARASHYVLTSPDGAAEFPGGPFATAREAADHATGAGLHILPGDAAWIVETAMPDGTAIARWYPNTESARAAARANLDGFERGAETVRAAVAGNRQLASWTGESVFSAVIGSRRGTVATVRIFPEIFTAAPPVATNPAPVAPARFPRIATALYLAAMVAIGLVIGFAIAIPD